jgi:diguanylate cyclase (GGDEF)-like protein/PAS domain S-box-containing protein
MIQENDINFRLLTYEVNVGIYVCDPDAKFIYANLALTDILGLERPAEVLRRGFTDFIPPGKEQVFMNQFRKSLVSGTGSTLITTDITRRDGKRALIEISSMPFIKNNTLLGSQGVVHDISKYKKAENQILHSSTHDPLTGIYNRTFFEAELKRLERGRQFPISIIMVLMGMSASDDYEGRDKLIKRVAHQLFYSFRGDDIVARTGDKEFAILLPGVAGHTANEIIKRINGDLQKIDNGDSESSLQFYIGIATARKGEELASVLKQAQAIAELKKKKGQ